MTETPATLEPSATVVIRRRVEHADVDAYRVVHVSRYVAFLETAVLTRLEQVGLNLASLEAAGAEIRVRELHLRYLAAARYGQVLVFEVRSQQVGVAHLRMFGRVSREDGPGAQTPVAEGWLDVVFVVSDSEKPLLVPPEIVAGLETP